MYDDQKPNGPAEEEKDKNRDPLPGTNTGDNRPEDDDGKDAG